MVGQRQAKPHITEQADNPALTLSNITWKPRVSLYTYDVNGHVLGDLPAGQWRYLRGDEVFG